MKVSSNDLINLGVYVKLQMLDTVGKNQNKLDSRQKKIRIMVLGNDDIGKTSISSLLTSGDWSNNNRDSLGVSFSIGSTIINDDPKKFVLFNLASMDYLYDFRTKYYEGADLALLIYDISNLESFEILEYYIKELISIAGVVPIILLGNKSDLKGKQTEEVTDVIADRFVTILEAKLAYPVPHMHVSCKTMENIPELKQLFQLTLESLFP